ncbi:MAG TPA: peptide deformylase [Candidatus Binatia bacterium]|nr:peptide deformylase [Candidatus Binatia bacterium]
MSILKVARLGHPVLRAGARTLTAKEVASAEIQRLIEDMVDTMREYNGVGLAAVQVHEPLQIAVLEVANNPRYPEKPAVPLSVLINPLIEPLEQTSEDDWEGCLSVPDLRGLVPRYTKLRVRALSHEGRELDFVASGFHARVIQHEFDHLNGKVYLDRMPDLSTLAHLQEYIRYWAEK